MNLYLDTSSLLKLFLNEQHSGKVREWIDGADLVSVSRIGYPEAMSAVERRFRAGDLTREDRDRTIRRITDDWDTFFAVDFDEEEAGRLVLKHGLRALDALHGVWTVQDGVLTASEDQCIWTTAVFGNFVLDLEFKTARGSNSGVVVHCSDTQDWIPNSVEIQIADDYAEQWAKSPKTWQCGAIFGRLAAKKSLVKKPGEWNRFTITCQDHMIYVMLNGEQVTEFDMRKWTSATKNPDGSDIPPWLSKPLAQLATKGCIGLQGKHAGAPIYFRNVKDKETP